MHALQSLLASSTLPTTLLAFAVVLGVLVFVHELGHYLAARWRGIYVEAFSIGFGRALLSWTDRAGTVWKLSILPLGGYVRMQGMTRPDDAAQQDQAAWRIGQSFFEKSVLSRAIVVAAGPIANFVLAAVLFTGLFATVGREVRQPTVSQVTAGGPAARAGLQGGDRIGAIDGTPIQTFDQLQQIVQRSAGRTLSLLVRHGDAQRTVPVTVEEVHGHGLLGIANDDVTWVREPLGQAALHGVTQVGSTTAEIATGVWQIVSGQRSTDELGGPLRIAQLSGQVAKLGLASLVLFIALLSVHLGLINLFPIPILDGGYLLFFLAEAIRGRPVPPRALEYGFRAGFALIAAMFVFATWNDLSHLGLMRWVSNLIG